jgi:hypothetical protein
MSLLLPAETAQLQADMVAAACDKTCQVYRKTTTSGPSAEPLPNYTLNATTVAGMTQPGATLLQNYAALIGSLKTWHVKMPTGTDVRHQDRLLIEGVTLEVNVLLTPQSYSVFTNCLASEVE